MSEIPNWEPLNEAKQEAMKEGNRSVGTKNTRAYEKEYGKYNGEFIGEIEWAALQETN